MLSFRNLSLRRKQMLIIMLTSTISLLLACAAFVAYDVARFRRELVESVSSLAEVVGHNSTAALDFSDPAAAAQNLAALRGEPNIVRAHIHTPDGQVFATYARKGVPLPPELPHSVGARQEFTDRHLHLFRPIIVGSEQVGSIELTADLHELRERLWRYAGIAGLVLAVSLLVAFGLSSRLQKLISHPILHLAQLARAVAVDKNYSVRATKQSNDELGQLVDGFNEMLGQIQQRDAALQTGRENLEHRVEKRTRELAESQSLYHSLVDQIPAGVFRKDAVGRFVFVNSWYCRVKGMEAAQILGRTAPEIAAAERHNPIAKWLPELATQGSVHHDLIMQTGETLEVEEEYRKANGRRQCLRVVKSPVFDSNGQIVGSQGMLFDITDSKEAEAELAYERHLLRMLLDFSPDSIYFKDLESRFIKVGKAQAGSLGCKNASDLLGKTDFDFFTEAHARPAFEDEQKIIRTGQPLIGKVEKEVMHSGRESWALTSKMPLRNNAGQIIGTFGISKDITAIKVAETKLDQVHKQLLETSRLAGMAEVAINVLHNVGNVLNSVNVSTGLLVDNVKKSKTARLAQVVGLMREHGPDLGEFITNDPKGKQVPGYLAQLSEHLLAEQAAMVGELDSLQRNVEHIKEIVAMQQSYATFGGVKEIINVVTLVEDSLRMHEGTMNRHRVEIIREFGPVPPLNIEKHKILQILVNLIRNAKHDCQDSDRVDKRVTVRVANGAGRITISVTDNGVGIPAENLTRIFNHGFTTRKDGHGFGLHSGALAAKEMGGSLTVASPGPGQGATFTLELPSPEAGEPT